MSQSIQSLIEKLLAENKWFRERKDKNFGIAKIIVRKFLPEFTGFEDKICRIVTLANSLDRIWRKVLQEKPELRGTDYDTKEIIEQEKQMELGYEVGFEQDIKLKKKV